MAGVLAVLGAAVAAFIIVELVLAFSPWPRWKLRKLPGPAYLPFLGNLPQVIKLGSPKFFQQCKQRYGPVFKVWFGKSPAIVIADADLVRQVGFKLLNHSPFLTITRGYHKEVDQAGLVSARDAEWRVARAAWAPAFSPGSLSGYVPLMRDCADQLAARLAYAAAMQQRLDIWRELGNMTLAVVGTTAYGIDFKTIEPPPPTSSTQSKAADGEAGVPAKPSAATAAELAAADADDGSGGGSSGSGGGFGRRLAQACQDFFLYTSISRGSRYGRLGALLPELRPVISLLAYALPDTAFRKVKEARQTLIDTCQMLIDAWTNTQAGDSKDACGKAPPAAEEQLQSFASSITAESSFTATAGSPLPSPAAGNSTSGMMTTRDQMTNGGLGSMTNAGSGGSMTNGKPSSRRAGRGEAVAPGSFLGLLLDARDAATGNGLTDVQIMGQAQTFILAGYETTANALAFAIHSIASNPDVETRLLAEIDAFGRERDVTMEDLQSSFPYVEAVFAEALRMYPPAHGTTRQVGKGGIKVAGHDLPEGSMCLLSIYAVHHDPKAWPRPEEFIPERHMPSSPLYDEVKAQLPNSYIPFGLGSRMCIGYKFALMEAKMALVRLYQRLRFELEPGQVPLALVNGITMCPRHGVWVTVKQR